MAENNKLIQPVGYAEMYEWVKVPHDRFARFVQFSKRYPDLIEPYHDASAVLAGVSTICALEESDDPKQWKYAYMCTNTGDTLMREETLAVGIKCYDQHNEFSYISTRPWKHYVKVPADDYDPKRQYVPRTSRNEWVRVSLLGKTIVMDDGTLKPGTFCMPYTGDDMQKAGSAIEWDGKSPAKFYVLDRMSDNTVIIVLNTTNIRVGGESNG